MNTDLVQYGHPVGTKQYTKNLNAKHAVKAEISMKIVQCLVETFGIFCRLVAE